jgi:tight adherence protein C
MGLAIFAFVAIFVLIGSAGFLISYRVGMTQRLSDAIAPDSERANWLNLLKPDRAKDSLKAAVQPFDRVLPKTTQEISVAQKRLIRAGYRDDSHLRILYGSKALVPIVLCLLVFFSGVREYFNPFIAYALALALGYLIPDFWLGHRISKRYTEIRLGLPDFLDLVVVCMEAGLSLDQALSRTLDELQASQPEITDEMTLLILEQRAGKPRVDSWKSLVDRVDIEIVRTLAAAIVQADQFGTSITRTLRVYSDGLRVRRRQQVEELAAKTSVKLVFPLVFFIFPTLFIVALGPSMLAIQDSFAKYFK